MSVECVECGRDVYDAALEESGGCCPYCEQFLTPPSKVLEQWQAIRLSGVTNMGEWDNVIEVASRNDFYSLIGFLQDESRIPTKQLEAISRGLDGDVEPAKDPEAIRERDEEIAEQIEELRMNG